MTRRDAVAGALASEGPLCSGCTMVAAELRSTLAATELQELESSGHVRRTRILCPGCQEIRLVATLTGKDLSDVPPSPRALLKGSLLEEALIYANPAVLPGSIARDLVSGEVTITVRCLRSGCSETRRLPFRRLPRHALCTAHRLEDAREMAQARVARRGERSATPTPVAGGRTSWQGMIVSIQPRIGLLRSFDERSHSYLGYVLGVEGTVGKDSDRQFLVAIGEGAQGKHALRVGDRISGTSLPVADPEKETAAWYKTSALTIEERSTARPVEEVDPPFHVSPPSLAEYRSRGHRRLDPRTYVAKCMTCVWGCRMPVEMIIDHWNRSRSPDNVRRRMETFCYGPEDCPSYRAGPVRRVPGRKGMVHEDDGNSRGDR